MNFNRGLLRRRRDDLKRARRANQFLGSVDWRVPRSVVREMEIADAARQIVDEAKSGLLRGRITPETIAARLQNPETPDPDLIIRTSDEQRLSNRLLWQAAYRELWFTPVFWPDVGERAQAPLKAIRDYQKRDRRFGGLSE